MLFIDGEDQGGTIYIRNVAVNSVVCVEQAVSSHLHRDSILFDSILSVPQIKWLTTSWQLQCIRRVSNDVNIRMTLSFGNGSNTTPTYPPPTPPQQSPIRFVFTLHKARPNLTLFSYQRSFIHPCPAPPHHAHLDHDVRGAVLEGHAYEI
jgi:hypothetical protein